MQQSMHSLGPQHSRAQVGPTAMRTHAVRSTATRGDLICSLVHASVLAGVWGGLFPLVVIASVYLCLVLAGVCTAESVLVPERMPQPW